MILLLARILPALLGLLALLASTTSPWARQRPGSPSHEGLWKLRRQSLCRFVRPRQMVQLRSGPGLRVSRPERAWGSPLLVRRVAQVMADLNRTFVGARPIRIHDIGARRCEPLPLHTSHRTGQDADIRLPQRAAGRYRDATALTLDVQRTLTLVLAMMRTCDVEFIILDWQLQAALHQGALQAGLSRKGMELLLEYPNRDAPTAVQHMPRHRNHLHVRFRCPGRALRSPSARALCRRPSPGDRSLIERMYRGYREALAGRATRHQGRD